MQIAIKYFGKITEFTQKKEELISIEGDSVTLFDVETRLKEKYPKLTTTVYAFAINQTLVRGNMPVKDFDEIALLPPFAGG